MPFIYVTGEWLLLLVYLGKDYIEHINNQKVNYSNEQLRTNNSTNIFSLESLRLENLHIYICLLVVSHRIGASASGSILISTRIENHRYVRTNVYVVYNIYKYISIE